MSKRVLCKFFSHGACLKGEHCEFSHDWKDPSNNVCTFYQKGFCSYGSRCRYEHVKVSRSQSSAPSSSVYRHPYLVSDSVPMACPSKTASVGVIPVANVTAELSASSRPFFPPAKPSWNQMSMQNDFSDNGDVGESRSFNPAELAICSFAAAGNCPRGEKCPHIHGDLCPTCGKYCLHPFRPEEREEHTKTCEKKQKHLEALKHSQEIECSVCLERVLLKPTAAERKFGLLSECDHPFCVSCIRNWRSSSPTSGMDVNSSLRACPICRKLSYFVIPSVIWYSNKEEKQEIIDSYKAKLRSIDCKHFDFGNGTCPFGTSCFYKHTVKPGSYLWNSALGLDTCSPSFLDMDDTDKDMNELLVLFEHLYRPHTPVQVEELDNQSAEDFGNELSTDEEMAFLLMQPGFDMSDSSSDEDIYIPRVSVLNQLLLP